MTHTSPTSFAVWSVLSTALGAFLLGHLYRFDKFKCLKWSNAPYSGAFKRIMTYSYLITIPLIMTYSFGFTYIKYKEGFLDIAGSIVPMPYTGWRKEYRDAILPLMIIFAFAWSFEMVTHLEELCFWYFLITAGPAQPDWFRSRYFRIWVGGSVAALVYLPVVTIVYRDNPLGCEARVFTAGSVGDLVLTLTFIPILFRFPEFIRKVKAEGVDASIIVRLRKFYELNVIRIVFRFLMQVPLLALGIDGLKPHHHELNESLFWTDLLIIVAALGCVFSSICTLLIFFPRSYEAEYRAKEASRRRSIRSLTSRQSHEPQPAYSQFGDDDDFDRNPFERSSLAKSGTLDTMHKFSDAGHFEEDDHDDFAKIERAEQRMGTGLVKERFSSKLRERERRFTKGTKKIGVGLQGAFSRRLARKRKYGDAEGGSSAISLSLGVPSSRDREERDTATRRTTPSARSATRKRSGSLMEMEDGETGAGADAETEPRLERKGTYLLTDSPVLRAQRLREQQRQREAERAALASAETLEAAYEAGAGAGARMGPDTEIPLSTSPVDIAYGTTDGDEQDATVPPAVKEKKEPRTVDDADVTDFRLDSLPAPPLSAAPSYRQATGLRGVSPERLSPTGHGHVHGPRPVKKSTSISTTATAVTSASTWRALPMPPMADPLSAAPAYYPPGSPPGPSNPSRTQSPSNGATAEKHATRDTHEKAKDRRSLHPTTRARLDDLSAHPFASATSPLDRQEAPVISIDAHSSNLAMRETNDAAPPISLQSSWLGPSHATTRHQQQHRAARPDTADTTGTAATAVDVEIGVAGGSGMEAERVVPPGSGLGLTAANLARLNHGGASRSSQVNPLVRTFTSPIDFLDRIQENDSSGAGYGGTGANSSRVQFGWAV